MGQNAALDENFEPNSNGKRVPHPNSLKNLQRGGPGRTPGIKNRSTLLTEALMQAKVALVPRKIRDEYLDVICGEELINLVTNAKKEEIRLNSVREGFDRTRGKPQVTMEIDSHSQSIHGTLGDLLQLLQVSQGVPEVVQIENVTQTEAAPATDDKKPNP